MACVGFNTKTEGYEVSVLSSNEYRFENIKKRGMKIADMAKVIHHTRTTISQPDRLIDKKFCYYICSPLSIR